MVEVFPHFLKVLSFFSLFHGITINSKSIKSRGMPCTQCEVLDSSALRISTLTNKVRHSRITHNPHSFIAFVHLPCVLGLKDLQGIPTP